jgi:1-acyl-sn-glycerol-3-phosphate acyltransferase
LFFKGGIIIKLQKTVFDTTVISSILRLIARILLFGCRWQSRGNLNNIKKCVLIAAPHTSNWDLFYTLLIAFDIKASIYWMGKDAIFRKPFGGIMKWLGGLPIDRSKSNNIVEQSIEMLKQNDKLKLTVPPSGTRSRVTHWKTGFYHIANGANVPITLGYLDYRLRVGGIGPSIRTTGDIVSDMKVITSFYANITGKYPIKGSDASVYIPPRDEAA